MSRDKSVYNFASTRTKRRPLPADHLDYDSRRAMELGYGVRYGQYKADHPNTREEYERLTEANKPTRKKTTQKERVCPICGKTFCPKPGTVQTYCSPECKETARYRNVKAAKERKKAQIDTVATCPICGKEFVVTTKHRKYCSVECSNKSNRVNSARLRELYRQEAAKHDNNQ